MHQTRNKGSCHSTPYWSCSNHVKTENLMKFTGLTWLHLIASTHHFLQPDMEKSCLMFLLLNSGHCVYFFPNNFLTKYRMELTKTRISLGMGKIHSDFIICWHWFEKHILCLTFFFSLNLMDLRVGPTCWRRHEGIGLYKCMSGLHTMAFNLIL